jgi:hypothetical protein
MRLRRCLPGLRRQSSRDKTATGTLEAEILEAVAAVAAHLTHAGRSTLEPGDQLSKQRVELFLLGQGQYGQNTLVCTENLIRVEDVMESPKLAE